MNIDSLINDLSDFVDGDFEYSENKMNEFLSIIHGRNISLSIEQIHKLLAIMTITKFSYITENISTNLLENFGVRIPNSINCYFRNSGNSAIKILEIIERNSYSVQNFLLVEFKYRYLRSKQIELNKLIEEENLIEKHLRVITGGVDGTFYRSSRIIETFHCFAVEKNISLTAFDINRILACYLINKFDYPWENCFMKPHVTRGKCEEYGARIPTTMTNQYRANKNNHVSFVLELIDRVINKEEIDHHFLRALKIIYLKEENEISNT